MEPTPAPQNGQKTILLVDDDATILQFVSEILHEGPYNILTACNGPEAVQQSADYKGKIDILLSAFQMTGMSGVDVATQMTSRRPALVPSADTNS